MKEEEATCSCGGGENNGHNWNCPWQEENDMPEFNSVGDYSLHPTLSTELQQAQERIKELEVEKDLFAMSFCAWYCHAEDAQVYKSQGLSAYKMLELYKSRPFLRTDAPDSN